MCEGIAYVVRNSQREEVMAEVAQLQVEGDQVILSGLLGEQKAVRGTVERVDFLQHTIIIRETA